MQFNAKTQRHRAAEPQPKPAIAAENAKNTKILTTDFTDDTDEYGPNKILAEMGDLDR